MSSIQASGPTLLPHSSAATRLLVGEWGSYAGSLQLLLFLLLLDDKSLSLLSFPSFISILIVLSSLLWQARVGMCKFPDSWKSSILENRKNGSKSAAKP